MFKTGYEEKEKSVKAKAAGIGNLAPARLSVDTEETLFVSGRMKIIRQPNS